MTLSLITLCLDPHPHHFTCFELDGALITVGRSGEKALVVIATRDLKEMTLDLMEVRHAGE